MPFSNSMLLMLCRMPIQLRLHISPFATWRDTTCLPQPRSRRTRWHHSNLHFTVFCQLPYHARLCTSIPVMCLVDCDNLAPVNTDEDLYKPTFDRGRSKIWPWPIAWPWCMSRIHATQLGCTNVSLLDAALAAQTTQIYSCQPHWTQ